MQCTSIFGGGNREPVSLYHLAFSKHHLSSPTHEWGTLLSGPEGPSSRRCSATMQPINKWNWGTVQGRAASGSCSLSAPQQYHLSPSKNHESTWFMEPSGHPENPRRLSARDWQSFLNEWAVKCLEPPGSLLLLHLSVLISMQCERRPGARPAATLICIVLSPYCLVCSHCSMSPFKHPV